MTRALRAALAAAFLLAVVVAPAALAYNGEVSQQVVVSGPRQIVCPGSATLTATVVDLDGKPLEGIAVTWSTGQHGTTNSQGQTSITITVATAITVKATTAEGAVGSIAISCTGGVGGVVGLPRTDTAIPASSTPASPATLAWVWLLAIIGSGVIVLAKRRR